MTPAKRELVAACYNAIEAMKDMRQGVFKRAAAKCRHAIATNMIEESAAPDAKTDVVRALLELNETKAKRIEDAAHLDAARKDAERLDWLFANFYGPVCLHGMGYSSGHSPKDRADLDHQIKFFEDAKAARLAASGAGDGTT